MPFCSARSVNSPGSAGLAPASTRVVTISSITAGDPWHDSSTTSSPVTLLGPGKKRAIPRSTGTPWRSKSWTSTARRGATRVRERGETTRWASSRARGPERRTIASGDLPVPVAGATIVSWLESLVTTLFPAMPHSRSTGSMRAAKRAFSARLDLFAPVVLRGIVKQLFVHVCYILSSFACALWREGVLS